MPWIAQLTDSHLDGGEADARFERVATWLERFSPAVDAIVLTGDMIEAGTVDDVSAAYGALAARLAPIAPIIAVPGNCDDPEALAAAFPVPARAGISSMGANSVLVVGDAVAIVGLDAQIPGSYEGRLPEATLAWLETTLAALPAGMPIVLALHYPPVKIGHGQVDGFRLQNPERLAELIARDDRIVATLVGHTHGGAAGSFAGRPLIIAPGIHSAMTIEHEAQQTPPSLLDFAAQPGIALHWVDGDTITTHFRSIAG
jgi:3',5'-cyclic AMP phosphodiesterase CpdA